MGLQLRPSQIPVAGRSRRVVLKRSRNTHPEEVNGKVLPAHLGKSEVALLGYWCFMRLCVHLAWRRARPTPRLARWVQFRQGVGLGGPLRGFDQTLQVNDLVSLELVIQFKQANDLVLLGLWTCRERLEFWV